MKITNGNWLIQENLDVMHAVAFFAAEQAEDSVRVYVAPRDVSTRGAQVDVPIFTYTFFSRAKDTIGVRVEHYQGSYQTLPRYEVADASGSVTLAQDDDTVTITCGKMKAIGQKQGAWKVSFSYDGKYLTGSGEKAAGYAVDKGTHQPYVFQELHLGVGEYAFGLGERFSPFIKNGQVVDLWNRDGGTGSEQAYKNVPFYLTNRGYGVFIEQPERVELEVASEKVSAVQFSVPGESLTYHSSANNGGGAWKELGTGTKQVATKSDVEALGQTMATAADALDTDAIQTADEHVANLSKDLFSHTLPSASDLNVASKLDAYFAAKNSCKTALEDLSDADKSTVEATYGDASTKLDSLTLSALQVSSSTNAQDAYNKVINAGRTLVAPVAGASRAAALIERATESNIIRRAEVLRNRPPKTVRPLDSKLEGKDALMNENIWADVRYNDVDIDTNEYCGKSNVAIANYQLGYDQKISDTDYVGAFIGTTRGDFNFYSHSTGTSDGTVSLKGAFNAGIYGTHILPKGHYVDYLVHYSKFDNDFADKGIQWKTQSIGAMILMGWKKTLDHGYLNPYVSFSTQKIANDDMRWCGNVLATKDQTNTGIKVGVDYSYNGGAFGGIAYSRGLSGHLAAAVNDIALPSLKNDEQILYLKLGYRGKLNQHTNFDLTGEQYLLDYDGWSMNGKVEIGF